MSDVQILIVGRVVERVLTVLICGASLGFGWNLFRHGIINNQQAEFSKGNWKVALRQVGPGVFFALFACVGLVYSISAPLKVTPGSPVSQSPVAVGQVSPSEISYGASAGIDKNAAEEILAINTITLLWRSDMLPSTPTAERQAGQQASQLLLQRKEFLLRAMFHDDYSKFKELTEKSDAHPDALSNLSAPERAQFDRISQIANDSLLKRTTP
jgi:hypothetical protein